MQILLVEDEEVIRTMAKEMLKRLDCEVVTAADGREGIELYREAHANIDLVILDLVMPEIGGKDAFLEMKSIDSSVVAVIASGYSLDGEVQEILDQGAKGFVQKPFRINDLSQMLTDTLGA